MKKTDKVINKLLVEIFNDILQIEEKTLRQGHLSDLSVTEIHTIEAIGIHEKRTMSEVAQDLKITVGTLTTAVNKLIKKGYVERSRIEEDRRVVLVELTAKGNTAYKVHENFHEEMVKSSIEGLTEDEGKVLIGSLGKLNQYFKEKCRSTK